MPRTGATPTPGSGIGTMPRTGATPTPGSGTGTMPGMDTRPGMGSTTTPGSGTGTMPGSGMAPTPGPGTVNMPRTGATQPMRNSAPQPSGRLPINPQNMTAPASPNGLPQAPSNMNMPMPGLFRQKPGNTPQQAPGNMPQQMPSGSQGGIPSGLQTGIGPEIPNYCNPNMPYNGYAPYQGIPNMYLPNTNAYNVPMGIPIFPLYGYDNSADLDRDVEYMKQLYPKTARSIQREIDNECDQMEYDGSMMFDEYPDKEYLDKIVDRVYTRIKQTEEEPQVEMNSLYFYPPRRNQNYLRDIVSLLLLSEIFNRRRRHRSRKRWF